MVKAIKRLIGNAPSIAIFCALQFSQFSAKAVNNLDITSSNGTRGINPSSTTKTPSTSITPSPDWSGFPNTDNWKKYVKVSVESDALYNSAHSGLDSRASRLNLRIENKNLKAILDDMGIESYAGVEAIFGLSIKISGVPTLVKGMTETELHQTVDHKLQTALGEINTKVSSARKKVALSESAAFDQLSTKIAGAKTLVDTTVAENVQKLNEYFSSIQIQQQKALAEEHLSQLMEDQLKADPNFSLLGPNEQTAMLLKARQAAEAAVQKQFTDQYNSKLQMINDLANQKRAEIDSFEAAKKDEIHAKVSGAKKEINREENHYTELAAKKAEETKQKLDRRVNYIQLDTTIQEVAFVVGKSVLNDRAIVFAKGGKLTPDLGGHLNERGFNQIDSVRPMNTYTTGGMGTAGTGGIQFGTNYIMAKGKKIQIDIATFHDRPNFYSGSSYVSEIATMTDAEYARYKEWYAINSVVGRMLFYSGTAEVYGSFGSYNSDLQGQVGVDLKLNNDFSIHAAFTKGERKNLKEGASTFVVYKPLQRLKIYTGFEFLKGLQDPIHSSRPSGSVDRTYSGTGAQFIFLKNDSILNGALTNVNLSMSVEYQKTIQAEGYLLNSLPDNDFVIGSSFTAQMGD